jgi:hypothetical protein
MAAVARGECGGRKSWKVGVARRSGVLVGEGRRSSSSEMRKFAPSEVKKAEKGEATLV